MKHRQKPKITEKFIDELMHEVSRSLGYNDGLRAGRGKGFQEGYEYALKQILTVKLGELPEATKKQMRVLGRKS